MLKLWSNFVNRSVSRKLAFYIISIGLMVATTALIVRLLLSYQQSFPLLQDRVEETVEVLLPPIQHALEQQDAGLLVAQMARLTSSPDINSVRIVWFNRDGERETKVYPRTHQIFKNPIIIEPFLQLKDMGNKPYIQSIEVDISFESILSELKSKGLKDALIILVEAIVLAFVLIRFVDIMITRHLRDMAYYAGRLGLDKLHESFKLNRVERELGRFDELDQLALALNSMRKKLHDDVRERQVMELSLMAAKEEESRARRKHLEAEASNRAKGQFIATVSHEIRTPMNGIIGMIDLLSTTDLNESQRQYIETIKYSGASLTRVINDILDYSKIEADKLRLDVAVFNLDDLIDECIQLFSAASTQNNIELLSAISSSTPRFLQGDPARLRQIILNLLGNAFKFTQEGYVYLNVSLALEGNGSSPLLHFSVTDTGIGIAKDSQGELFKPFNQADSTITRKFGGTGLGLAIAQNLVRLMGGEIGVDSELGKGASFWFTVQLDIADNVKLEDVHHLEGKRILLVNSDRLFNASIVQYCQTWQMTCQMAYTGEEALAELSQSSETRRYDAVLVNYTLPDFSGELLIDKIRDISRSLVTILMSCQSVQDDYKNCKAGAFLARPVTSIRLKRTLSSALATAKPVVANLEKVEDAPQFPQIKVLVAEDNPVNCMVIEGILKKLGMAPIIAKNGEIAYNAFVDNLGFDLVFMDCEMPIMDGFAATQKIREWESLRNQAPAHIVALTAHVESEHKKRVFSCGMDYYLSKPITVSDVSNTLTELGFRHNRDRHSELE